MRVITRGTLRQFWENPEYTDSKAPLDSWYKLASKAEWKTPQDVKAAFRSASFVRNNRVVFNIAGNKYRLIVAMNYEHQLCYVKFIGTHKQYDQIDAGEYDEY